MARLQQILRMRHEIGWPMRRISEVSGVSLGTVHAVLESAAGAGIGWPLPEGMDEARLARLLYPSAAGGGEDDGGVDFAWVHEESRGKGVTLKLLWIELCDEGYRHSYQYFCRCYKAWAKAGRRTMRQRHDPGDTVFADFAGMTVRVGARKAQVFVAAFGLSHYAYAEAVWTQSLRDWLGCQTRMLEFFGGVPQLIVPDNLKSGVSKACHYDPDVNGAYQQWAAHYNVSVMPTRPYRPKDKAVAENAVLQVERWVLAPERHRRFDTLDELNREIRRLVKELNDKPFSARPGSRAEVFEATDLPALRPLPVQPYRYCEVSFVTVGPDYHVQCSGRTYSVPHEYVGSRVELRDDGAAVTVFYAGMQIAAHRRGAAGEVMTEVGHMPADHAFVRKWTPDRIRRWAAEVGPECSAWVCAGLDESRHRQTILRPMLGLLSQRTKYGDDRLNDACALALRCGIRRVSQVIDILRAGTDQGIRDQREIEFELPQSHENVRGARAFE